MQADINDKMRAILLDWLVEVHLKFKVGIRSLKIQSINDWEPLFKFLAYPKHEMEWPNFST